MEANSYQQITQNNEVSIEMDLLQVGSEPVGMRCPYCQEDVMTKAHYINTSLTHIIALVLGILFWYSDSSLSHKSRINNTSIRIFK
nr:uncharacterized protein LOC116779208 isoform X2 [Danaus plexippus plexippus]